MADKTKVETNYNDIRLWLQRAQDNTSRCFICRRIASANIATPEDMKVLKFAGVELTPEMQISHLARCVGARSTPA